MSTGSLPTTVAADFSLLPPARFSSRQYLQMVEAGIFGPADKVELIDGVITPMVPAGPEHNASVMQFPRLFAPVLGRFELLIQGTVVLGDGQVFDPDMALLTRRPGGYRKSHPTAADIQLVVESAASSLPRDRQKKLPAYAAAGIQEYWIMDLEQDRLLVHRQPTGSEYQQIQILGEEESVSPLACPELEIKVVDLFA
jgi:Uma2 family endonuclease